jgi:hypothetical protein
MTLVYIPAAVNVAVHVGAILVALVIAYRALISERKQLYLGEDEEMVVYGRKTKPQFIKPFEPDLTQ